jgi:tRNA threonylcarbamoyladenosine biosynthesis protein TsaE
MKREMISNSDEDTIEIGREIAESLLGGEVILLRGGLGAGKTLLTKGILGGLGFDVDEVTSPSFTLVNLYPTEKFKVYHIDLWRLEGPNPEKALGLDELLSDGNAVFIIEWSERLKNIPRNRRLITIEVAGDGDEVRVLSISEQG